MDLEEDSWFEEDEDEGVEEEEEDSFDAPVPMSKSAEAEEFEDEQSQESSEKEVEELDLEEEDFDLVTIEKVSMNVLVTRMGRIISEIMLRGEPAAHALFDVANKIVFQSTMMEGEENKVIEMIIRGLTKIILDAREREERAERGAGILTILVAKLAIKNKSLKCDELLFALISLIENLYQHFNSLVRIRICRLIALIVEESNKYAESRQERGDHAFLFTDDDVSEPEEMIPDAVMQRWLDKLASSLLDKAPLVRSAAVAALSLWDIEAVYKNRKGDELSINELLWKSIHDVDEGVRVTAARRVPINDEAAIDKCMNYIATSKDNKVRQAIVNRLSSDVSMLSFSDQQRFRLINILSNSDSARVQDSLANRLVDAWMKVAEEEVDGIFVFRAPRPSDNVPKGFPTIILEFLDPLIDPNAAYIILKLATVWFIRKTGNFQSDKVDLERFMKDLLEMTESESECVGLMRRSSFRLVEDESDDEECLRSAYTRVFITRTFLDVVFQLSRGHLNSISLRDRALMFFTPDVTSLCAQLEQFCESFFQKSDEPVSKPVELLLLNIFHIINVALKHGNNDFDKEANRKSLEKLIRDPNLQFSCEIIVSMVTMLLDLCKNAEEVESACEWISTTAGNLLLFGEDEDLQTGTSLEEAMKEGLVPDRMYFRSAKMLLATCQHTEVQQPSPAMSTLFKAMIPALLGSQNEQIQVIGLELIGSAASIDFENCGPYLKLIRILIHRDDEYLKVTGLHTFVRVIKSHGFSITAQSIFEEGDKEEQEESLAKLIEKTVVSLDGMALAQAVRDCLSMLSHVHCAWPKLQSALLLICFQKRNEDLQLVELFKTYCKTSIRSKWSKVHLLQSFTRAISVVSKSSESDASWNIGAMTTFICEHLSSVHTVGEDNDEDILRKGDDEEPVHIEVELANRMISRAQSHSSARFIRHVFASMATSLSLQCVPIDQLKQLHNTSLDCYHNIRFNSGRTTQIAFKRFITHCEKMISLYHRRHGLLLEVDLRKVKLEEDDPYSLPSVSTSASTTSNGKKRKSKDSAKSSPSKSKKKKWDSDGLEIGDFESEFSEDSFEYLPIPTKTRNWPKYSEEISSSPPEKRPCSRLESAEVHLDDSFEL